MPNIGAPELIIILVIALLILGPGKLPEVGASIGKSIREFRKASSDLSDSVNVNVDTSPLPPTPPAATNAVASPTVEAPVAPVAPVAPAAPAAPTAQAAPATLREPAPGVIPADPVPPTGGAGMPEGSVMSLVDHLSELRDRLVKCVIVIA